MDSKISHEGRISQQAAVGTTITLYILAILVATFRTFVRWRYGKLSWLDDGFLAVGVVLMTASLGLWFAMIDNLYKTEALIYDPFGSATLYGNIIQIAISVQIYTTSYIAISLTGIFAIKFSFLFFFRSLISRLRRMIIYWRIVVGYTAIVWAVSVGISFLACPYYDSRAVNCAQDALLQKALDVSIALLVFDVTSDALIISIPILVIMKVKIPLQSKLYLAFSFCLSAVMIVCAILQGATLVTSGSQAIDVVWQIFFQMVELTLAVLVVSLTAFRTFFIQRGSRSNTPHSPANGKWYSYKKWKKSISDRTTSTGATGMTGFTGFSEEMPLSDAPRTVDQSEPKPQDLPIDREPFKDVGSPFTPSDLEKGPPPSKASNSARNTLRTPTTLESIIPISPQTPFTPGRDPMHSSSPQQPISKNSSDASSTDIAIPIQGSESPTSATPLQPLQPTLTSQALPPPEPPRLGSLTSHSSGIGLPPRTPPYPKPFPAASAGPRTALQGPSTSSAHSSRTDSMSRPLTGHSSGTPLDPIPQVPPLPTPTQLPQLSEPNPRSSQPLTAGSRTSTMSSRGVPARKPLPSPSLAPRPSPSPSKASSIAAAAASLGMDDCFGMASPSSQRAAPQQQQRSRQGSHVSTQVKSPSSRSYLSPTSNVAGLRAWQAQRPRPQGYRPQEEMMSPPAPPSVPAGSPRSPRTPRSNLNPDLRISGVQRLIRSGIERAMNLEPATGEGDRW